MDKHPAHSSETERLLEGMGSIVLKLPASTSFFNPIEYCWAWIKHKWRNILLQQDQNALMNANREWVEDQLRMICRSISTESLKNFQKHTVKEMYDFISSHEVPAAEVDDNEPRYWMLCLFIINFDGVRRSQLEYYKYILIIKIMILKYFLHLIIQFNDPFYCNYSAILGSLLAVIRCRWTPSLLPWSFPVALGAAVWVRDSSPGVLFVNHVGIIIIFDWLFLPFYHRVRRTQMPYKL